MGYPRQEYWSGLLFPSPGHLPDPGTEPASALQGGFFTTWQALLVLGSVLNPSYVLYGCIITATLAGSYRF